MFIDYTQCKSSAEMIQVLEAVAHEIGTNPGPFITLNDFTGNAASREYMKRASELAKIFDPKTKKSAVLGIHGITKLLLQAYNHLVKNKQVPFETKEEAMNYLVE
ncbi:MAG TPA: hypothetical protein DCQ31_18910 [Bacteroidales bacterium]|nr:hypothetical protein [Bacteroidales bacterium]